MTYVPYYIDKALADANLVGLPISLQTRETAHKQNKRSPCFFLKEDLAQ